VKEHNYLHLGNLDARRPVATAETEDPSDGENAMANFAYYYCPESHKWLQNALFPAPLNPLVALQSLPLGRILKYRFACLGKTTDYMKRITGIQFPDIAESVHL
jgi:hypothetical protein